jgi:hypothetical protein
VLVAEEEIIPLVVLAEVDLVLDLMEQPILPMHLEEMLDMLRGLVVVEVVAAAERVATVVPES